MREKAPPTTGLEPMIVTAPQTQEFVVRDFEDNWPAVSLAEHNLQLLHALNLFSTIHEKEWMLSHPDAVARRYPKNHAKVLETTKEQRQALQEEARTEFFRSIGYYAVQDSGIVDDLKSYTEAAE